MLGLFLALSLLASNVSSSDGKKLLNTRKSLPKYRGSISIKYKYKYEPDELNKTCDLSVEGALLIQVNPDKQDDIENSIGENAKGKTEEQGEIVLEESNLYNNINKDFFKEDNKNKSDEQGVETLENSILNDEKDDIFKENEKIKNEKQAITILGDFITSDDQEELSSKDNKNHKNNEQDEIILKNFNNDDHKNFFSGEIQNNKKNSIGQEKFKEKDDQNELIKKNIKCEKNEKEVCFSEKIQDETKDITFEEKENFTDGKVRTKIQEKLTTCDFKENFSENDNKYEVRILRSNTDGDKYKDSFFKKLIKNENPEIDIKNLENSVNHNIKDTFVKEYENDNNDVKILEDSNGDDKNIYFIKNGKEEKNEKRENILENPIADVEKDNIVKANDLSKNNSKILEVYKIDDQKDGLSKENTQEAESLESFIMRDIKDIISKEKNDDKNEKQDQIIIKNSIEKDNNKNESTKDDENNRNDEKEEIITKNSFEAECKNIVIKENEKEKNDDKITVVLEAHNIDDEKRNEHKEEQKNEESEVNIKKIVGSSTNYSDIQEDDECTCQLDNKKVARKGINFNDMCNYCKRYISRGTKVLVRKRRLFKKKILKRFLL